MFFVYDNKDARAKRAFSVYFTFLLPKRLGMPFSKGKSYAKCTKKAYELCQNWFSKFRSEQPNISTDWTPSVGSNAKRVLFFFVDDCSNFQRRILITSFSARRYFFTCVSNVCPAWKNLARSFEFRTVRNGFDGEADIVFHVARSCEDRDGEEMRKSNFSRRIILY